MPTAELLNPNARLNTGRPPHMRLWPNPEPFGFLCGIAQLYDLRKMPRPHVMVFP